MTREICRVHYHFGHGFPDRAVLLGREYADPADLADRLERLLEAIARRLGGLAHVGLAPRPAA